MAKLNIYKIEDKQIDEITNKAADKLNFIATKEIVNDNGRIFGMSLYMIQPQNQKEISWNWLLNEFDKQKILTDSNPRGIIEIKAEINVIHTEKQQKWKKFHSSNGKIQFINLL